MSIKMYEQNIANASKSSAVHLIAAESRSVLLIVVVVIMFFCFFILFD